MQNVASKWLQAISVLIELTQQGRLKWQVEGTGIGLAAEILRSSKAPSYRAKYQESWFRLTKKGGQEMGALTTILSPLGFTLEIIDEAGNSLFVIPETSGLQDLYQAVQYQLSGVDKVLNSLLQEKSGRI